MEISVKTSHMLQPSVVDHQMDVIKAKGGCVSVGCAGIFPRLEEEEKQVGIGLTQVGAGSCFLYAVSCHERCRSSVPEGWRRGSWLPSVVNIW
jgi:hypothetical protein